jgi:hypothetical protein
MTEPLRTDPATAPGASSAADQAARVEQLLLAGLDQYFAGQYEQAINIWTRVVFLERRHNRARAYIERARSAMAERQRESEELLHRGVAAYHAGDTVAARTLLTKAVEQGSEDDALAFLQRLNRVEASASAPTVPANQGATAVEVAPVSISPRRRWEMTALALAAALGAVALGAAPLVSWATALRAGTTAVPAAQASAPLPVVRPPEREFARARSLYAGGHLFDALRVLDRIDIGDPLHADAERLRGDIQRDLLAIAGASAAPNPQGTPR